MCSMSNVQQETSKWNYGDNDFIIQTFNFIACVVSVIVSTYLLILTRLIVQTCRVSLSVTPRLPSPFEVYDKVIFKHSLQ